MKKYIVWIKEGAPDAWAPWEPNGDGPMTEKTAQRVAEEIRRYCLGCRAKVLPVGVEPPIRK